MTVARRRRESLTFLRQHRQRPVRVVDPGDRSMVPGEGSRAADRFIVGIGTALEGDFAAIEPLTDLVRVVNASGNDVVGAYARHRRVAKRPKQGRRRHAGGALTASLAASISR